MNRDIMDIACVGGNGGFSIVDQAGLNACVWPASIVVYYGDISPSWLGVSMPWPVWLIYDLYPSLEAVAFALSGFDGGSDGIRKYVFITQQHVSIIGLVGFTTRRNTLVLDY